MPVAELSRYFDIQGSPDLVSKAEVRTVLRERGQSITDRNLTYYASLGLIPPAIRIGSRMAAYPEVVVEQLSWVITSRDRGLSIDAIRELLPLWQWLVGGRSQECVDLNEFEVLARRSGLSDEANLAVPGVVDEVFQSLCGECRQKVNWVLKDGSTRHHTAATPVILSFMLGRQGDDGVARLVSWTQLTLPGLGGPDPSGPMSITLGLPLGVPLTILTRPQRLAAQSPSCRRRKARQREELPLP